METSPVRTLFSEADYRKLLKAAKGIDALFELAVVIAHETGHRIGAIRQLRWSDVDFTGEVVRWRGEHDKIGTEHRTPISAEVTHRLKRARRARLRLGDGWIFPSPTDPERPF